MFDLLDGADTGELDEAVDLIFVLGCSSFLVVDVILHHHSLESDLVKLFTRNRKLGRQLDVLALDGGDMSLDVIHKCDLFLNE